MTQSIPNNRSIYLSHSYLSVAIITLYTLRPYLVGVKKGRVNNGERKMGVKMLFSLFGLEKKT